MNTALFKDIQKNNSMTEARKRFDEYLVRLEDPTDSFTIKDLFRLERPFGLEEFNKEIERNPYLAICEFLGFENTEFEEIYPDSKKTGSKKFFDHFERFKESTEITFNNNSQRVEYSIKTDDAVYFEYPSDKLEVERYASLFCEFSQLFSFYVSRDFFTKALEKKLLTKDDFYTLCTEITSLADLHLFTAHSKDSSSIIQSFIDHGVISVDELIDAFSQLKLSSMTTDDSYPRRVASSGLSALYNINPKYLHYYSESTFSELSQKGLLTIDHLMRSFKNSTNYFDLYQFLTSIDFKRLLKEISFKELVDKCCSTKNEQNEYIYHRNLFDRERVETLPKRRIKSGFSFYEIDDYKMDSCLAVLIHVGCYGDNDNELIEQQFVQSIKDGLISKDELMYFLDKLFNRILEFDDRCTLDIFLAAKRHLLPYLFENYLVPVEVIDKMNEIIAEDALWKFSKKSSKVRETSLFEFETHKNALGNYKAIFDLEFSPQETQIILDILKNSDKAKNLLNSFIENNLLDTYSFETLKNLLTKDNEKRKGKFNF